MRVILLIPFIICLRLRQRRDWTNSESYDGFYFENNPVTFPLAPTPSISSFTVSTTGGTESIITIYGSNFGESTNPASWQIPTQQVQFKNANYARPTDPIIIDGLDNTDYVSWEDDKIEIKIPSFVYMQGQGFYDTPGSGTFKVITDWGKSFTSSTPIDIQYSIQSIHNLSKSRISLPRLNCIDGMRFRLGTTIVNNSQAVAAIEKALNDWSSYLDIDMSLDRNPDGTIKTTSNSMNTTDRINSITYDSGVDFMGTNNHLTTDYSCGSSGNYGQKENDIGINQNLSWNYDLTGASITGYDFYGAILHELGHSIGLKHVIEEHDLMNATQKIDATSSDRQTLTSGRGKAALGSQDIISKSKTIAWSCGSSVETLGSSSTNCPSLPTVLANFAVSSASSSSVNLSWSPVSDADSYVIEYSLQANSGFQYLANPTGTTYTHTGLNSSTTYYYRIKAWNVKGASAWSDVISTLATGVFDDVEITDGPTQFKTGESPTYFASFTSGDGSTYPVSWNWAILLYYNGGTYTLASKNEGNNMWQATTNPVLPSYNWVLDQSGNISGEVLASANLNDGDFVSGTLPISVVECNSLAITNQTYTSNTTKQACYVTLNNVNVKNNATLTIDSEMGTTIEKDFNVAAGSQLDVH